MKRFLAIGAALLQIAVLCYMAGEREWVLRNGRCVWLRTVPVDPRDPFRGDYVRLDYEVSHVPRRLLRDGLARPADRASPIQRDARVFAVLTPQPGGVAGLEYLTDRLPGAGLYMRGRTSRTWGAFRSLPVRYGLEAMFVQEHTAKRIEDGRLRGDVQVPMEVEAAVGRNGMAVLRSYRWGTLGIGLHQDVLTNRQVQAVTAILMNVSSSDVAVVDLPGGRSLALEDDDIRGWGSHEWQWVGAAGAPPPAPTDADVRVLKPGQSHAIRVDLSAPAWFVTKTNGPPQSLRDVRQWEAMFRLRYRAPSPDACSPLREAARIWHGDLLSRAFGGGRVD